MLSTNQLCSLYHPSSESWQAIQISEEGEGITNSDLEKPASCPKAFTKCFNTLCNQFCTFA
jgi:hypothetical protein